MAETTLGQRIAQRRKGLGLSQEAFGEKLGVSRQAASKWESDAAVPEIEKLITMSRLFGVSVDWLLDVEVAPIQTEPEEIPTVIPEELPDEPPKPPRRWQSKVCAAAAAVGVTAAVVALVWAGVAASRVSQLQDTNGQLQSALDAANQSIGELQVSADLLEETIESLENKNATLQADNKHLSDKLSQLQAQQKPQTPNETSPWKRQTLPASGLTVDWMLTAVAETMNADIQLQFSCMPEAAMPIRAVWLRVRLAGEVVAEVECQQYAPTYAATLTLPPADGYEYDLAFVFSDATREQMQLQEQELSHLQTASMPRVQVQLLRNEINHSGEKFWLRYEDVTVKLPELLPQDAEIAWENLKLVYTYDGKVAEEKDVTELLEDLKINDPRYLYFSTPTLTYTMAGMEEAVPHEIHLRGILTVNGSQTVVDLLLNRCRIYNGIFTME